MELQGGLGPRAPTVVDGAEERGPSRGRGGGAGAGLDGQR